MITWIKFSERQPEKEGEYLCCYKNNLLSPALWDYHRFWLPPISRYHGIGNPIYWAEINLPEVTKEGVEEPAGTGVMSRLHALENGFASILEEQCNLNRRLEGLPCYRTK